MFRLLAFSDESHAPNILHSRLSPWLHMQPLQGHAYSTQKESATATLVINVISLFYYLQEQSVLITLFLICFSD